MYSDYGINCNTKIRVKNINKLLLKAIEKEMEDSLWEMWKLQFPNMNKENFISFNDYKNKCMKKKHSEKSYEEIENEMVIIEQTFKGRR